VRQNPLRPHDILSTTTGSMPSRMIMVPCPSRHGSAWRPIMFPSQADSLFASHVEYGKRHAMPFQIVQQSAFSLYHNTLGVCLYDRMRKRFQTKLSYSVDKITIVSRRFFPLPTSNAAAAASHRGQRWVTKLHRGRVFLSCDADQASGL
jgi:hypothetical protein